MSNTQPPIHTPDQLLELETICDSVEQALNRGSAVDLYNLIQAASPELQDTLRAELESIHREYQTKQSSQTKTGDQETLSPDDFMVQAKRVVEFPSQDVQTSAHDQSLAENFGRFQLHSIVGRGGSGVVWRAFDGNLNRWVALKLSHPHSAADSKRFVREAQAVAKLKHPNIIPIYEAGELSGRCFLVSEFCEGQPLSNLIERQPFEISHTVQIVLAVLNALEHSHHRGIIHRDIKPHNVMINADGIPMVTDFGLAKNIVQDQTLTLAGELIGTPSYMAPEQAQGGGELCDERTDIYSVGVMLFQLLTGKLPFTGGFERVVFQVINSTPPKLRALSPNLPTELELICAKCLEKSPELRYRTAGELRNELLRFTEGKPLETQRVPLLSRYTRWLKREPRIAWALTACAALLIAVASISTTSAYLLASAWKNEKAQVLKANESLASAVSSQQQAVESQNAALAAKADAQENAARAEILANSNRQEANFLASLFSPVDLMGLNQISAADSTNSLSMTMIEKANQQADQLLHASPIALSRIKSLLANAWRSQGQLKKAQNLLAEATKLLTDNCNPDDSNQDNDRAINQLYWAYLFHQQEKLQKSESHYQKALQLFQRSLDSNPGSALCELQLAQAEFGFAALLLKQKRNSEAKPHIQSSLDKRRRILPKGDSLLLATELVNLQCDPENSLRNLPQALNSADEDVAQRAMILYWDIASHRNRKDFEAASGQYLALIDLIEDSVGANNWLYLLAIGDFAALNWEAGNYQSAYSLASQAIEQSQSLARWHPKRMQAMMLMAFELQLAQRFEEAKKILKEVEKHPSAKWNDSIELHCGLAWCNYHTEEPSNTLNHSESTLRIVGKCTAAETAWYHFTHATMLAANDKHAEAHKFFQQAVSTASTMLRDSDLPNHSTWLMRVGLIFSHENLNQEAEQTFRRAIQFAKQEYFADHPRVTCLETLLAETLLSQQRNEEAKQLLEHSLFEGSVRLLENDKRLLHAQTLLRRVQSE